MNLFTRECRPADWPSMVAIADTADHKVLMELYPKPEELLPEGLNAYLLIVVHLADDDVTSRI